MGQHSGGQMGGSGGGGVIITVARWGEGDRFQLKTDKDTLMSCCVSRFAKYRDCLTHLGISHVLNHRFTYSYNCPSTV